MSNYIYSAPTGDGWLNLARDGYFLENNKKGDVILYFYVNKNAVIIGRNQNAWKECSIANMDADGVQLVRRHSGGGAVFHDNGNLNFSFITDEKHYDLNRQMRVILNAVSKLGLKAELSGRNDITVDGKKFSGNAFSLAKGNRSHHGTILVNADLTKLSNYLCVSKEKMRSKGIDSVRARVCNLCELSSGLTVEAMRRLVIESFIEEYGAASEYVFDGMALAEVEERRERLASWEWRFGKTPQFDFETDKRFSFGDTQIYFNSRNGVIRETKVYSDCLDTELTTEIENALTGVHFRKEEIKAALSKMKDQSIAAELAEHFCSLDI
ncbi:MAG TPA: lipoate--protein ligase [Clostridia bacterium]|nr:lipoate--protein ligase [Clostridia bacterium]HRN14581.1 lipoate--protein ligase [Clostridia bacterium]